MAIEDISIGLRAQDIQMCLQKAGLRGLGSGKRGEAKMRVQGQFAEGCAF